MFWFTTEHWTATTSHSMRFSNHFTVTLQKFHSDYIPYIAYGNVTRDSKPRVTEEFKELKTLDLCIPYQEH